MVSQSDVCLCVFNTRHSNRLNMCKKYVRRDVDNFFITSHEVQHFMANLVEMLKYYCNWTQPEFQQTRNTIKMKYMQKYC